MPATSNVSVDHEEQTDLNETLARLRGLIARRRWWILATACGVALAAIAVVLVLPNRYTSEAILLVVQQQVPERYVTPTTTTDIASALEAMKQEVLSRTRLLGIIEALGLYPKERQRLTPDSVIALMRNNVEIEPIDPTQGQKPITAFRISFTAEEPHIAQEVASRLSSLFIQENVRTREDQANITTSFFRTELDAAKTKLDEAEQRLRDFKIGSLGELPEQQAGNVQVLAGLQSQLQNAMASISRAQQQRLYLQSLAQGEIARLQSERRSLLALYTPKHPRVVQIDREIAHMQAQLEGSSPQVPETDGRQIPAATAGGTQEDKSPDPIRRQLEANQFEIENLSKDEKQLKADIAQSQQRLNLAPVREQQLSGILRDYNLLKQNYADLLGKEQQSQLAMSLEKQQEGQHFRLVDPPSLPSAPSSPKRMKISLGGAAAGLGLGLVLAFLLEVTDHSLRTEKEINLHFSLPLILCIPLIELPFEGRRRAWRRAFECLAGFVLVLAVAAAEFYVYRLG